MALTFAGIVDVTRLPNDSPAASAAAHKVRGRPTRRTVLRAIVVSSLTVGGNFLSLGARLTMPRAFAEISPDGARRGWNNCHADYTPQPDTGGRYADWPPACHNGTANGHHLGSKFCNSSGWHRRDSGSDHGVRWNYDSVSYRCWGGPDSKNAWRWQSNAGRGHPATFFRCSDGQYTRCTSGRCHSFATVCRAKV
jgi:hypothetical protein